MRKIIYLLGLMLLAGSCAPEPTLWTKDSVDLVIAEYVAEYEEFSEFAKMLDATGLYSLLSVRGPFTMFLATDSVMQIYYDEIGIGSAEDLSVEEMEILALNHMVPVRIETGEMELGSLRELNGNEDNLVSEFLGAEIYINKESRISKRNIQAANGVIHHVDRVIKPVVRSVYQVLADDPGYSIFTEGLELTGLKDTLDRITFPYGNKEARTRFTVLAVADSTFQRFGVDNVDELIDKYTDARDSLTYLENGFYRYMEYHCMGGTYYLNNLELDNNLYPILSFDNNISITVDDDYKINADRETGLYTAFHIELSNIPGKNGTIHTIDDLLPVFEPEPTLIIWETTDHFDLQQGDYFGKYYARWFDGQNTFEDIKWSGDYLLYYFKDFNTGPLLNDDCLSMSGWWWVEVKTPKIMRGKYTMFANLWDGQINYEVWVDGVQTALIDSSDPNFTTPWGDFEWDKTERHTIKVRGEKPGPPVLGPYHA